MLASRVLTLLLVPALAGDGYDGTGEVASQGRLNFSAA